MSKIYSPPALRHLRMAMLAPLAALMLVCVFTLSALAATVNVYDNANVLNGGQVRSEASSLRYAIDIYTTNKFQGTKSGFDSEAQGKLNRSPLLIIAIDTVNKHVFISGRGTSLNSDNFQQASNNFASTFRNGNNYTDSTVSAIRSLRDQAGSSSSGSSGGTVTSPSGGGFNLGFAPICCIGLLVLAGLAIFGVLRGRRNNNQGGGGFGGFGGFNGFRRNNPPPPTYDPNYGQPYNQGGYPPNYGPGYPQQRQGMNPWAAGGLGAAAGGLVGYELGKNAGDRGDGGGNFGGDNSIDGGAGADFGGGGGGGGGADFGGGGGFGGDSGGGFSGDAGGGGGGGGSDF